MIRKIFQYPQSGSRLCRVVASETVTGTPATFSTLKAGRDSAADSLFIWTDTHCLLSVPSKRVETLPPARNRQEQQPGVRLSVPSKRVETLPPFRVINSSRRINTFSTLKAGRDSAA